MTLRSVAALLVVLTACGPTINQAAKSDVDKRVASLATSEEIVPAPEANTLMPLAAGQWIEQHMVDDEGRHSFVKTKVLSQEGSNFWIEVETQSYYGTTALKLLLGIGNRNDPTTVTVHDYWLMDDQGTVTQYPPALLSVLQSTMKEFLTQLVIAREPAGQGDTTVPAGGFAQAYKARVETSLGTSTFTADVWWHPAVPINGQVKTVGVSNSTASALVAYGTTGASSVFP